MQIKEHNPVQIREWYFCQLDICERLISSLKDQEIYYLRLDDVDKKFINKYYTPKEIDEIIDLLKDNKQLVDIPIHKISVIKDQKHSGMYVHPQVAFLYWMRHDERLAIMLARLMMNFTFHKEEKIRMIMKGEVQKAFFEMEINEELIEKYLPQINKQKIETITKLAVRQYNDQLELFGQNQVQFGRVDIFGDSFYVDMMEYICRNCGIKQADDEFVSLMIYQRFYQIKIVWNDSKRDTMLEEYFGAELKRLEEGILPHYALMFFNEQQGVKYVGKCRKYLNNRDVVLPFKNVNDIQPQCGSKYAEHDDEIPIILVPSAKQTEFDGIIRKKIVHPDKTFEVVPLCKYGKDRIRISQSQNYRIKKEIVNQITQKEYDAAPTFKNVGKIRDAFMNNITIEKVEDPIYRRMVMIVLAKHFIDKEASEDIITNKTAQYFNTPIKQAFPEFKEKFIRYPKQDEYDEQDDPENQSAFLE